MLVLRSSVLERPCFFTRLVVNLIEEHEIEE